MLSTKNQFALRALICSAVALGVLGSASSALASRAFLEPQITKYEAASGEANRVTFTDSNGPGGHTSPNFVEITDSGAEITAQWGIWHAWGCEEITFGKDNVVDPHRVWCAVEGDKIDVNLGDLGDEFSAWSFSSSLIRTRVFGGPGDDDISGGPASDLLFGGPDNDTLHGRRGADVLSGGDGIDTVDYSNRTDPLGVSIPEPVPPAPVPAITVEATQCFGYHDCVIQDLVSQLPVWPVVAGDDGELAEGDDVAWDVENVTGGSGNDWLYGSSAANKIYGSAGNDTLRGRGGDDILYGGAGVDSLNGGSGDDRILAQDGEHDSIDCGSGNDLVYLDPKDSIRDCNPEELRYGG